MKPPVRGKDGPLEAARFVGASALKSYPGLHGMRLMMRYLEERFGDDPEMWGTPIDHGDPRGKFLEEAADVASAAGWVASGCPRYVLSESLAALLSLTRAPAVDLTQLPYDTVTIEVPSRFFPLKQAGNKPVWITLARLAMVEVDPKTGVALDSPQWMFNYMLEVYDPKTFNLVLLRGWTRDLDEDAKHEADELKWAVKLMIRFAANVLSFVTAYQSSEISVRPRGPSRNSLGDRVFDLGPPPEVTIDKTLRTHAAQLVQARTLADIRQTLRHVVCGHWKKQPVGPRRTERKLIWVQPYPRGDNALGRVAEKVMRLDP